MDTTGQLSIIMEIITPRGNYARRTILTRHHLTREEASVEVSEFARLNTRLNCECFRAEWRPYAEIFPVFES